MSTAKATPPQLPKGTRDFYPEDMRIQNFIFDAWKRISLRFGYEEYEGPIFEHLELFTGKSGDEIVSQLYNFEDKGGRGLALRPEMTPTLARLVIQRGNAIRKPFKWFSIPRLFRYERAQKGRLREFFQLNLDVLGTESIYAEADLITATATMLLEFGLKPTDFMIGISSRKLLAAYLQEIGTPTPDLVYPILDRRLKIGPDAFAQALLDAGLSTEQGQKLNLLMSSKSLEEVKKIVSGSDSIEAIQEMEDLFEILTAAGLSECIGLDLNIVRGLAYYTGIVFEVFNKGASMRAIAGGGRYDSLCEKLGGARVPGVGFGMGDVVLADLLRDHNLLPAQSQTLDVFVATFTGDIKKTFVIANAFRKLGFNVVHPLSAIKFGKQMELANAQGAACVVYVDGEKAAEGEFEFKDLAKGTMAVGSLQKIAEYLKKWNRLKPFAPSWFSF